MHWLFALAVTMADLIESDVALLRKYLRNIEEHEGNMKYRRQFFSSMHVLIHCLISSVDTPQLLFRWCHVCAKTSQELVLCVSEFRYPNQALCSLISPPKSCWVQKKIFRLIYVWYDHNDDIDPVCYVAGYVLRTHASRQHGEMLSRVTSLWRQDGALT